jgi:hypothetical protein
VLEVLDRALVPLCRWPCLERAEIATLAGLWIPFPRVEPVLAGFQFSDHTKATPVFIAGSGPMRD